MRHIKIILPEFNRDVSSVCSYFSNEIINTAYQESARICIIIHWYVSFIFQWRFNFYIRILLRTCIQDYTYFSQNINVYVIANTNAHICTQYTHTHTHIHTTLYSIHMET